MSEGQGSPEQHWERAAELPLPVLDALRRPLGESVVIMATVDADGAPRTAAFGSFVPMSPTRVRFGCDHTHDTFANLVRDGRVMLAVFAPPNVAVGILGRARMIKAALECRPTNAVFEVDVDEVKNDAHPLAPVVTGISYALSDEAAGHLERYLAEVTSAGPGPDGASA